MNNKLPPTKYLRECFRYEAKTGLLYWRKRPRRHFTTDHAWVATNTRFAGKRAFTSVNTAGHFQGKLDGVKYQSHRVVWKLVTGKEPPVYVDHKNRNRKNNRWGNLRKATNSQNIHNQIRLPRRKDLAVGVCRHGLKWRAKLTLNYKQLHLGLFATKKLAIAARRQAQKKYLGEFAP